PVVVEVDSDYGLWQPAEDSFSTFVYCSIWDYSGHGEGVQAQDEELSQRDLAFLQSHFQEGPRTYGFPPGTQYRFSRGDQKIVIWASEGQADWWLSAGSVKSLEGLIRTVWQCGSLARSLYPDTSGGKMALERVRADS